jgi:stage IV sporulation protein FB
MGWSFPIAKVFGIEVRVHVTFFLLLAWIGYAYYSIGGTDAAIQGVVFILAIFGCVLLHEFGHALAARIYGIQTPDITLLPIGGVARMQRIPDQPIQEIVVALAGPAVNVVIAGVLFAVVGRIDDLSEIAEFVSPNLGLLPKLAVVNVWLVLFNMLPAFPMDGGRVLRAALAMFMNYSAATQVAASIGQALALGLGILGLLGNPMLIFIAIFVYLAATQESHRVQMKSLAQGLHVRDAMVTKFYSLAEHDTLQRAIDALLRTSQHEFPVVKTDGTILGIITRDDMLAAYRDRGSECPVTEVMQTNVPKVSDSTPLEKALQQMQECACPALAAVDRQGRLVGLMTLENLGELLMVQAVLPRGKSPSWIKGGDDAPVA